MRTKILILFLALFALPSGAADLITRWLVITNAPIGNTNSVTLNGSVRTYTNSITASPATLIAQTNVIGWAVTNTANQLTTYRVSFGHQITTGTNYFAVRGAVGENLTLTINACCFGFVTNSTQSVSVPTFIVRVPLTSEAATNQTSIGSLLVKGISDSSTNAFSTNSSAISNALIKGASSLQSVVSPVRFDGRTAVSSNFFATNGFTSAMTNINPVTSNLVNYGNAIRSEGSGGNSFQAGSNALAIGGLTVAIGNGAVANGLRSTVIGQGAMATNGDNIAIGTSAKAYTNRSIAIGSSAIAERDGDIAIGYLTDSIGFGAIAIGDQANATKEGTVALGWSALASATNSMAIGLGSIASGKQSIMLGYFGQALHDDSVAIGNQAITTSTNQIVLGRSSERVDIPGQLLISGSQSNTTFRGTNVVSGRLDYTSRAYTGMVNGNNGPITLGTNTYLRLSGATTIGILCSFEAEQDGSWHIVKLTGAITNTIANESGFDGTVSRRIITGTGGDVSFTNNPCILQFIYDAALSRWQLMGLHR